MTTTQKQQNEQGPRLRATTTATAKVALVKKQYRQRQKTISTIMTKIIYQI